MNYRTKDFIADAARNARDLILLPYSVYSTIKRVDREYNPHGFDAPKQRIAGLVGAITGLSASILQLGIYINACSKGHKEILLLPLITNAIDIIGNLKLPSKYKKGLEQKIKF